ncbi:Photosystem ii reaction center w protein [Thalictrum thalictroides]|uniref:PSII 6.1 kDa protein n=1 Tax=Thalictrum thalictroides TaxID=46969 RepID=A0A7J6X052_THATH|nr:Photosystem ii reaction center w protein [Thalictrum thalictroides]
MATITATTPTSSVAGTGIVRKGSFGVASSPVLGLPSMARGGRLRCSAEEKTSSNETRVGVGMGASLMAAASAAAMSNPALALVDERLSTEGTGLPFGLSNNLLGWILFGVFGLIWTLYFTYTSTLDEDEESGLSL